GCKGQKPFEGSNPSLSASIFFWISVTYGNPTPFQCQISAKFRGPEGNERCWFLDASGHAGRRLHCLSDCFDVRLLRPFRPGRIDLEHRLHAVAVLPIRNLQYPWIRWKRRYSG